VWRVQHDLTLRSGSGLQRAVQRLQQAIQSAR